MEEQRDLFRIELLRHSLLQQPITNQFKQQLRHIGFGYFLFQIHGLHHEMGGCTDFRAIRHHSFLQEARTRELGLHIAGDPARVGKVQLQHMTLIRILEQPLDLRNGLVTGCRRCRFMGILRLHQGDGQLHIFCKKMLMRFDFRHCHLLDFVFPLRFIDFLHGDRNVGQQILLAESLDAEMHRIMRQFATVFLMEMVVLGILMPVQAHAEPFHHRAGLQAQVIRQQFPACSVGHLPIGPEFLFGFV
ncbi:hypothetical protein SDC9_158626 [bioreactor metagenome]|uniref:Uncharacterized protein n=1 Tax=bioreactor metagenome TaxID=1076179 RepID=A0A645FAB6_9ZZZZ